MGVCIFVEMKNLYSLFSASVDLKIRHLILHFFFGVRTREETRVWNYSLPECDFLVLVRRTWGQTQEIHRRLKIV